MLLFYVFGNTPGSSLECPLLVTSQKLRAWQLQLLNEERSFAACAIGVPQQHYLTHPQQSVLLLR